MASIVVNMDKARAALKSVVEKLADREYLLRPLAFETIANMKQRIHDDGLASDGMPIGPYSSEYMKVRTRGAGVYTKGKNKGKPWPVYNRTSDTRTIVSLTRQLENDWSVVATPNNGYGIGFKNKHNRDKAEWVELIKKRIIFNLTASERDYIRERVDELVNDALR